MRNPRSPLAGPWHRDQHGLVRTESGQIVAILRQSLPVEIVNLILRAPDLAELLERHNEYLREAHSPEIEAEHGGDDSCTYCEAVLEVDVLLESLAPEPEEAL